MLNKLIEIRNNILSALEQNDGMLAKMYVNDLDTVLHRIHAKEETLEEAAERLYPDNIIKLGNETSYNAALLKRKDFIDGGNWVKERMYSEEDIDCLLDYIRDNAIETNQGWQINGIVYTNKELLKLIEDEK